MADAVRTQPTRAPAMPEDVDDTTPNAARIYDYLLGGNHNFAVDRELAERMVRAFPPARNAAMLNRAWLRRVVVDALDAGIRQFLDVGSGVPAMGTVHEIIRSHLPATDRATVVYVDYEAVAVQHSRMILDRDQATDWATIVQQDLRRPHTILKHPETTRLIDFTRPVMVLMLAVLHLVGPDDRPHALMATYRAALAPGSRLAISHGTIPDHHTDPHQVVALARNSTNPVWPRDRDQVRAFFGDWPLVHYPDLVHPPDWLPEPHGELTADEMAGRPLIWCGVAERPPA
ncbi:MAG TPA: SAM-dependent methyltransferase [Pseudonocardiaceae bacterium]|nr:SAM-dependent methyltransferase [Pseudonocardiaceae bacterium]